MKERQAIAEIAVDPKRGWVLPGFGAKKPDRFRYQAYAHFEKDETWGQRTWTLLVDLAIRLERDLAQARRTPGCLPGRLY